MFPSLAYSSNPCRAINKYLQDLLPAPEKMYYVPDLYEDISGKSIRVGFYNFLKSGHRYGNKTIAQIRGDWDISGVTAAAEYDRNSPSAVAPGGRIAAGYLDPFSGGTIPNFIYFNFGCMFNNNLIFYS